MWVETVDGNLLYVQNVQLQKGDERPNAAVTKPYYLWSGGFMIHKSTEEECKVVRAGIRQAICEGRHFVSVIAILKSHAEQEQPNASQV